jgi:transposase InsO family protein
MQTVPPSSKQREALHICSLFRVSLDDSGTGRQSAGHQWALESLRPWRLASMPRTLTATRSSETGLRFGRCKELGVRPSMGSVADCYDNAMAESFFATPECELLHRHTFRTRAQARFEVFEFIVGWYNPHRLHSALGYRSPIEFERDYEAHQETAA